MSEGCLKAIGSSSFLRNQFKTGYRLTCKTTEQFNALRTLVMIQNYAPGAEIQSQNESEVAFNISKEHLPNFEKMFKQLEDKSEELKITGYTFNLVPFMDTYLKILGANSADTTTEDNSNLQNGHKVFSGHNQPGYYWIFKQILAMFLKKYLVLRRSWITLTILTILSTVAIFVVPKLVIISKSTTELRISLDSYKGTETFVQINKESNLSENYLNLFTGKDKFDKISRNLESKILEEFQKSKIATNHKNLIATTFKNDQIIAWYNTQPYHTIPLAINSVNRAILKSIAGPDYDISVTNHPYSYDDPSDNAFFSFFIVLFLMIIWPTIFMENCIKEHKTNFKFQQFVSGTNRFIYWLCNLIFDYILFIVICILLFGIVVRNFHESEKQFDDFKCLMIVGASFGFSWICFIYLSSKFFYKTTYGVAVLVLTSIFCKYGLQL